MLKSNPSYLGIAGRNPALGPPKSALGLRPWADFGGPRAGFFPEFLEQGLDFLPKDIHSPSSPLMSLGPRASDYPVGAVTHSPFPLPLSLPSV